MKVTFELNEQEIRSIIATYLVERLDLDFTPEDVPIEVKSKQNCRAEWEWEASIRIRVETTQ